MKIIHGVRQLQSIQSSVLTVGNFDGVHLGHKALLKRLKDRAREKGVLSVVMTFEPHPVKVLYPDRKLHRIFNFEDQVTQMEDLGIDMLVVEPFSREFSQLAPERYITDWIFRPFTPETVVVGYDFSFGANRQGSIEFLKSMSQSLGFRVEVIPPVKVDDVLVSSTRIRQALEVGDVKLTKNLLGRPFYLRGLVVRGAGRGRTIGIPTANLHTDAETLPSMGVYAAWGILRGKKWKAAVNVGLNPTFTEAHGQPLSIETHLIDTDDDFKGSDLYGEELKLEFVARLRDEKKFTSVQELIAQIHRDIAEASNLLGNEPA
jgi:riboflavin kinase / FMN adenylyltransferase